MPCPARFTVLIFAKNLSESKWGEPTFLRSDVTWSVPVSHSPTVVLSNVSSRTASSRSTALARAARSVVRGGTRVHSKEP